MKTRKKLHSTAAATKKKKTESQGKSTQERKCVCVFNNVSECCSSTVVKRVKVNE